MKAEAAAGHVPDLEISWQLHSNPIEHHLHVPAMARRCSTFAACLLLTIANTFLAVYIIERLAHHVPKSEESGKWIEKDSECANRVENIQV